MRDVPQEGRAWGDEELGVPWFPFAIPVPPYDYEGGIRGVQKGATAMKPRTKSDTPFENAKIASRLTLVGVWERQPLTASPHIMILITDIPNIARSVVLQTSRLARAISRAAGRRSPGPSR
jgi:hypothetical protein